MLKISLKMAATCLAMLGCLGAFGLAGCSSGGGAQQSNGEQAPGSSGEPISVYSREDGSGTRGAFVELFGLEQEGPNGSKEDMTTPEAAITNSTSVMMTSVANDPDAIGYISLGSLNDSVKAIQIDGVDATAENVKNGSYNVSRPFNIVLKADASEASSDFVDFIMSDDGQSIIEENGYIGASKEQRHYQAANMSGKVVVAGSSSVTPVMEKLSESYMSLNPDVSVEVQQSDSTTGINMAIDGTCDIGMSSRDLKDSESSAGISATPIAIDGIAVIVCPDSRIDGLSADQVRRIFSGETLSWAEVA